MNLISSHFLTGVVRKKVVHLFASLRLVKQVSTPDLSAEGGKHSTMTRQSYQGSKEELT